MDTALIKAFTKDPGQGNPAGVVLNAQTLSDQQMQTIARELGYSETVFVLPSEVADYRTRFFTPQQEVDYCGHATLAAFHKLFRLAEHNGKDTLTQETKAGVFTLEKTKSGMIMMQQNAPRFLEIQEDRESLAAALGIASAVIHPTLPVQVVATNLPKLMVPITTVEALQSMSPDAAALTAYIQNHPGEGVYCFTISEHTDHNLIARYFNPGVGVIEDAATGVAAGPLGCYMDKYFYQGANKLIAINQGMWMGMSSDIYVDVTSGVWVGGFAAGFGSRHIQV